MESPVKPSWVWTALAVVAGGLALAVGLAALVHQRASDRPVGEGELFARDGAAARAQLEVLMERYEDDEAIRHLRNQLRIEAAALVAVDGTIIASTSDNLVGTSVDNPHLLFGLESGRLTALARPLTSPVAMDGVVEWEPGEVLYEVMQPLEDGAVLLDYDMEELLQRRARATGIKPLTVQMLGLFVILALLAIVLMVGRSRVVRRNREMFLEAQLLREHSAELESTNQRLRAAREAAEQALALAEEKNRIRAEFVLMINHELRTPLTAIVTGAELLAGGQLRPDDRSSLVSDMIADGRRLQGLIAQMLEAARIENRGLSLTIDVHTDRSVLEAAAAANPRLEVDLDTTRRPRPVRTHHASLVQLLGSLADNARTHGAGTVRLFAADTLPITPAVEIGTRPAEAVYFAIADDGPGIDPDFLPRVFEKFEKRGFNSGTGLGLYLAAMMVEALGASLSVETSPAGTTMVVAVPEAVAARIGDAA